jgi:hypothetical protein
MMPIDVLRPMDRLPPVAGYLAESCFLANTAIFCTCSREIAFKNQSDCEKKLAWWKSWIPDRGTVKREVLVVDRVPVRSSAVHKVRIIAMGRKP